jgi:hypothetical protein
MVRAGAMELAGYDDSGTIEEWVIRIISAALECGSYSVTESEP